MSAQQGIKRIKGVNEEFTQIYTMEALSSYLTKMADEITSFDMNTMKQIGRMLYSTGDLKMISEINTKIAYTGFNLLEAAKAVIQAKPTAQELITCCMLGVVRGGNIEQMQLKMSDEGKRVVNHLVTKFKIVKTGGTLGPAQMTFPRFNTLFPQVTAKIASCPDITTAGVGPKDYPKALQTTSCYSLIPRDSAYDWCITLVEQYQLSVNQQINSKKPSLMALDGQAQLNTIRSYGNIQRANCPLTDDERIYALKGLGVIFDNANKRFITTNNMFSNSSAISSTGSIPQNIPQTTPVTPSAPASSLPGNNTNTTSVPSSITTTQQLLSTFDVDNL